MPIKLTSTRKHTATTAMLLFFLLVSTLGSRAQGNVDQYDFTSWTGFKVDFNIHKQFQIDLREELRLNENSSRINQIFTEVSLKYSPIEILNIETGFRFLQEKKKNDYDFTFRFNSDLSIKHRVNRFDLSYRLRYTNKNELGISLMEGDALNHQLRFRTGVEYDIKKFKVDPLLDVEFFGNLNKDANNFEDKIRIRLSSDYAFKNTAKLGFFIAYERIFHRTALQNINIVGLSYEMKVKKHKPQG